MTGKNQNGGWCYRNVDWLEELFINEAKHALNRHSCSGSDSEVDVGDTVILVDENGYEVAAVMTDEEVDLTATANDIRLGTLAVTDDGVTEGTKEIPSYHTNCGWKIVTNGSKFAVSIPDYDYTKFQAIICPFNTSMTESVAADKVVIEDSVYPVQSTEAESQIAINDEVGYIDLGLTNNSGSSYIIRYFTYKEIY